MEKFYDLKQKVSFCWTEASINKYSTQQYLNKKTKTFFSHVNNLMFGIKRLVLGHVHRPQRWYPKQTLAKSSVVDPHWFQCGSVQIQAFDDQKLKKFTSKNKILFSIILAIFSVGIYEVRLLQDMSSAFAREHSALQPNIKFLRSFFLFRWITSVLLDPDPQQGN